MTTEELNAIGIRQWETIKNNYNNPDILLGNGFSINQSGNFRYDSLFDSFIQRCNEQYKTLFTSFGTTNFEQILAHLNHSVTVNSVLNLPTERILQVIEFLKNGLIETIKEIHPRGVDIDWDKIYSITEQLRNFGNIFSTNYDLYLYHIIMRALDDCSENKSFGRYQDYFWGEADESDYKKFMDFQNYSDYKHVYYLHGTLFIFNREAKDLKLMRKSGKRELIDIIAAKIQSGNFPLFITEGTPEDKLSSIFRSGYLRFCRRKLKESTTPLFIFGNSLSSYDEHITNALTENPRELIISVYIGDKTEAQLQAEINSLRIKFPDYGPSIEFVDSSTVLSN